MGSAINTSTAVNLDQGVWRFCVGQQDQLRRAASAKWTEKRLTGFTQEAGCRLNWSGAITGLHCGRPLELRGRSSRLLALTVVEAKGQASAGMGSTDIRGLGGGE